MTETRTRLAGLDLFRGLAVAGMIVVNTPGSGQYVWWPLDHAAWNGFTPTDLVFPAFLFAIGVALALAFPRKVDAAMWRRVARRTVLLIAIGWAWQMLARPGIATFRVYGVLPRIGLAYGVVAAFAMLSARRDAAGRSHLNVVAIAGAAMALLLGYWAAMMLVPVPGFGAGQLTPEGNLAGYVDRLLVGTAHMWRFGTDAAGNVVYDPEGLLSTLPSLANVLFGMLAGTAWQWRPGKAAVSILLGGIVLVLLGLMIAPVFPLNKRLWTSSYALFSSGLSAVLFAACIVASGRASLNRLFAPCYLLGKNAILGYMVSLLLGLAGLRLTIGDATLQARAFAIVETVVPQPYVASAVCALLVLALVIALLIPLHRRGIHLRL
ncbi:MAG: heparan-alpha-glucosaminide N-acetyltransferase domain-containing protein [Sphingomonas sp.]